MKTNRWLIVFLYVVLIFATIPYVPKIWNASIRNLGSRASIILNIVYGLGGCYLILYSYLKLRKRSFLFYAVLTVIFLSCTYLLKNLDVTIEKVHLLEYGLLSVLVWWAVKPKTPGILRYAVILGVVFLVGVGDELIQKLTPGRVCELSDVVLNWIAGILGFLLVLIFKRTD